MSAIDWLAAAVRAAAIERTLRAGQTLFRRGNRTSGLYEIVEGQVRLVRVNRAGREAVLHVTKAGDTMAEASLFSASYHCDAIATTDAVVRLYPRTAVLAEFDRNPNAARKFAAVLARQDVGELVKIGWTAKTEDLPNGVKLIVTSNDPKQATKLKALGFMGIMVQGGHHQSHHLMMAKGDFHMH